VCLYVFVHLFVCVHVCVHGREREQIIEYWMDICLATNEEHVEVC
jgi:hypothetical protein